VRGAHGKGKGEERRLRWQYMVDGLHIPIWNRTKKPLAIALSGVGRRLRGRDSGGNVNNVQYTSNRNCHYEPLHNEYILMQNLLKIAAHSFLEGKSKLVCCGSGFRIPPSDCILLLIYLWGLTQMTTAVSEPCQLMSIEWEKR
jgi:hypothetical protein